MPKRNILESYLFTKTKLPFPLVRFGITCENVSLLHYMKDVRNIFVNNVDRSLSRLEVDKNPLY